MIPGLPFSNAMGDGLDFVDGDMAVRVYKHVTVPEHRACWRKLWRLVVLMAGLLSPGG